MNLFKSLAGSTFCSQEHQKLYEEAEANKGFERLLQFVEKDPKKPGPAKPIPTPPAAVTHEERPIAQSRPVIPEPQTVAAKVADAAPEPPLAGFLLNPITSPAADASSEANVNFGILESGFPSDPPALPSFRFEIAAADLQKLADGTPPPVAPWANIELLAAIDVAARSNEVASVHSVRPRAIDLAVPTPDNGPLQPVAPPVHLSSEASGLQLAIQTVLDTRGFAKLARLTPLSCEARTASQTAQWLPEKSAALALSQPHTVLLSTQAQSGDIAIGLSGVVTRSGAGRKLSTPMALPPQLFAALSSRIVPGAIVRGVQVATSLVQAAISPTPRERPHSPARALPGSGPHHSLPAVPAAGLPRSAFLHLNLDHGDSAVTLSIGGAMTRAGVGREVRQPRPQSSTFNSTLGSIETRNRISTDLQDPPAPPDHAISEARFLLRNCVAPTEPATPGSFAGMPRSLAPRRLITREIDATLAAGITGANQPAGITSPLYFPQVRASGRSITIDIDRTARKVLANIQAQDRFQGSAIVPARQTLPDRLLPATLWSTETWLRSAAASGGWFHASDSVAPALPSGAPATRLFSIRLAPSLFSTRAAALAFERIFHRLNLEACESKGRLGGTGQEGQRSASSQPSRTSPLSLVARPGPDVTRLAARHIASLNRFTSIGNRVLSSVTPSAAATAPPDGHLPELAFPASIAPGLSSAFRLSLHAALIATAIERVERKNADEESNPHPAPLRAQPSSMLVRPGFSRPVTAVRWAARGGWATVAAPNLPKQSDVRISSNEETSLVSLRCLADAVRVDRETAPDPSSLRLNSRQGLISLDLGAQASAPGVASANALPRRRGPKLPVIASEPGELIVAGR